jgi:hypothetical protein
MIDDALPCSSRVMAVLMFARAAPYAQHLQRPY